MKEYNKPQMKTLEYIIKEEILPINDNYHTPTRWQRLQMYEIIRYSWNDLKEQAESKEEYINALIEALNGYPGDKPYPYSESTQINLCWFRYQLLFDDWHSLRGQFYSEKNNPIAQCISLHDIQNFIINCILKELEQYNIDISNLLTHEPHTRLKNLKIGQEKHNLYIGLNENQALLFELIIHFKQTNNFIDTNIKNKFGYSVLINVINNFSKNQFNVNNEEYLIRTLFIYYKETKYNRLEGMQESARVIECLNECKFLLQEFKNNILLYMKSAKLEIEFQQLGYLSPTTVLEIKDQLQSGTDFYTLINKNNYNLLFYIIKNLDFQTVDKFILPHIMNNMFIGHDIAKQGCEIAIPVLINLGISINYFDACMRTPLFEAIENSHERTALLLIDNGAKVNIMDVDKNTPLCLAIEQGSKSITLKLIQAGANVNVKCINDYSPLHLAVINDKLELIELLLLANALINAADITGETPLHLALKNNKKDIIFYLIKNNANILAKNMYSVTPLSMLVKPDRLEILAEATQDNAYLLALAAKELESKENTKLIDILLDTNKAIENETFSNMLFQYALIYSADYLINKLIFKQTISYVSTEKKYNFFSNDLVLRSSFHCKKIFNSLIQMNLYIARKYFLKLLDQVEDIHLFSNIGTINLFYLLCDIENKSEFKYNKLSINLSNKKLLKNLTTVIYLHYIFTYHEKDTSYYKGLSIFTQLLTAFKSKSNLENYTMLIKKILNQYPVKCFQPGLYYKQQSIYSSLNRLAYIPEAQLALSIQEYFMYLESNNKNLPKQEQEFIRYLKNYITSSNNFVTNNLCIIN